MGKNLFQVVKEVLQYVDNISKFYSNLSWWCYGITIRLSRHKTIEHELESYIKQEINRKCSIYDLFALVEYIFTQIPKIDNPSINEYIKQNPMPYGKFDKATNQVIWDYKPLRDPDDAIMDYVEQLYKPLFKMEIAKELVKDINRLTHQDILIEQYIQQIDNMLSVENLSGLSAEEQKQILVKLKYILGVSVDCTDDIINICHTDALKPFQNSGLKSKLYQLRKMQRDIDKRLGRKSEILSESVGAETPINKKAQKFRNITERFLDFIEFELKHPSTPIGKALVKGEGGAENFVFRCKDIINKITGQHELVEIYQSLVSGLCTAENWVWLTDEQKQIVKNKLDAITKEKVLYHDAICSVKVFDPTIPLSKSILQTKIDQLEEMVMDLEMISKQVQNN